MKTNSINIQSAFEVEPPPLDFVFPGLLSGTVGAIVAAGGTGKSFYALELAMYVASGAEANLLGVKNINNPKTGKVIYFDLENPSLVIHHRLHALGQYLSPAARDKSSDNLSIIKPVDRLNIPSAHNWLCDMAEGVRLIIIDTLNRAHFLDENSNRDMSILMSRFEKIAEKTGAAILILHHVSKGAALNGSANQHSARGASALIDNARWCYNLEKIASGAGEKQIIKVINTKHNNGSIQPEMYYDIHPGGVLLPCKSNLQIAKQAEVKKAEGWFDDTPLKPVRMIKPNKKR